MLIYLSLENPPFPNMADGNGSIRRPQHAGSWYTDDGRELNRQLENWLGQVSDNLHCPARAIIAPHAGYVYCGDCAAYAYKQIDPRTVSRIFILGPSHHVCLSGCALTACSLYRTPLYDLVVDKHINRELNATGSFEVMDLKTDEDEHSIEMHLPYIAKVMESRRDDFTIVPILVGSLSPSRQAAYGRILAKYLSDPRNLFVISSDFCHWGNRFHFTPHDQKCGDICDSIEKMDRDGMNIIETLDPLAFNDYLKRTNNTICGRHPICVMLQAAEYFRQVNNHRADFRFLYYSQSNKCRTNRDSSVSYAAGSLVVKPNK